MALPRLVTGPILLHAHDWHTALAPVYLRTILAHERPARSASTRRARCTIPGTRATSRPRSCPRSGFPWEVYNWHQPRVVREGQLAQGRPDLRRHGDHREPEPGGGAPHRRRRIRPAGRVHRARRPPRRHPQRDRPAGVESRDRYPDHRASTQPTTLEGKRNVQGRAPALVRAAAAAPRPAVRLGRSAGDAEGARPHPRARPSSSASDAQFVFLGSGEPRYERALVDLASLGARTGSACSSTSPTGSSTG